MHHVLSNPQIFGKSNTTSAQLVIQAKLETLKQQRAEIESGWFAQPRNSTYNTQGFLICLWTSDEI